MVGETGQFAEAEHAGGALDGMGGPEDAVERLLVLWIGIQRQQLVLDRLQMLGRLLEENRPEVAVGHNVPLPV